MIYLIGGAPRVGKSQFAMKVVSAKAMPSFSLDCLYNLSQVEELSGFGDADILEKGRLFFPTLKELLVVSKSPEKALVIVAMKPQAKAKTKLSTFDSPVKYEDLSPGQILRGIVIKHAPKGGHPGYSGLRLAHQRHKHRCCLNQKRPRLVRPRQYHGD